MLLIKEILILCLLYYWFIAVCSAVEIKTRQCKRGKEFFVKSQVSSVGMEPCLGGICEIYKGSNLTITVRFTPSEVSSHKAACQMKSKLVWVSKIDMDFGNLSPDACDYMDCPLRANKEAVFNATIFISKKWNTGLYPLKLKVFDKFGKKPMYFCRTFKIYLTDQPGEVTLT